jgi:outer membrane protein assembly factor BamB
MQVRVLALALLVAAGIGIQGASGPHLRWQSRGQIEPFGSALDVAARGNVVVASGNVCTGPNLGQCNWYVRTIDASDGVTLWEERLNVGGFDRSQGVVIHGDRVFASGWFATPAQGFDFVVRAYELRSGAPLWEQRIHRGGFFEVAELLGAHANRVFAVGTVQGASGSADFAVVALDAATGAILWESLIDPSGLRFTDQAFSLSLHGSRLFSVGPIDSFTSLLVRAYDVRTGQVLWEDAIPNGSQFVRGRTLASSGDRLFVGAGVFDAMGQEDLLIRAYDELTGTLVWSHQEDTGGHDEVLAIALAGDRLLAAGGDGCDDSFLSCSLATRAFDARTGALLWRDSVQDVSGGDAFPSALIALGGRALVGGSAQDATGDYAWTLRALDLATGSAVWNERITHGGVNTITAVGSRLFAAGFLANAQGLEDITVRAYELNDR